MKLKSITLLTAALLGAGLAASAADAAAPAATTPTTVGIPAPLAQPRQPDGKGTAAVSGELKAWHKVTLTLDGPFAHELDNDPNPFTDYNLTVTFTHESGAPSYKVPGYFAADGDAGNTSAVSGTKWRAHLSPDKAGMWNYTVSFTRGKNAALGDGGAAVKPFDGLTGGFKVAKSDKKGRDFRGQGRLEYVGGHYLQFAGSKDFFLKAGPDSPETLLAYADFDDTGTVKSVKTWTPHVGDWRKGDPTWKDGKGKGIIGALNYLAGKGVNVFSFLTYNAGGDGNNVWPFVQRDNKLQYDCSKLDQWQVVFDHAQKLGLYLHFKTQETENDDLKGPGARQALDGGDLGPERKLYYRELIARFGHELAMNWNLGEENTQSTEQQRAMARYFHENDPFHHNLVIHTYPNEQDKIYTSLLGNQSPLTGASLQNDWKAAHQRTLKWVRQSAAAGRPWVVANDEQGPPDIGVPCDPGYKGYKGGSYNLHDIRKFTLWGTLLAGGAGVEYLFGYKVPENDLTLQDFRSRDKTWDYCGIALDFFPANKIPFWDMKNANALLGNTADDNSRYCLAKPGACYLVYLPAGGTTELDLVNTTGSFSVKWFNPRAGGSLRNGSVKSVKGGSKVALGNPPADTAEDWLIVVRN